MLQVPPPLSVSVTVTVEVLPTTALQDAYVENHGIVAPGAKEYEERGVFVTPGGGDPLKLKFCVQLVMFIALVVGGNIAFCPCAMLLGLSKSPPDDDTFPARGAAPDEGASAILDSFSSGKYLFPGSIL